MEWLSPLASLVGIFVVSGIFSLLMLMLVGRHDEKVTEATKLEYCRKLHLTEEEWYSFDHTHPRFDEFVEFALDRVSSERFQVRLADFMGFLWRAFGWVCNAIIVVLVFVTLYMMYEDKTLEYLHAWWAYVIYLVFYWLLFWIYAKFCELLTGFPPGVPGALRQNIAEIVQKAEAARREEQDRKELIDWEEAVDGFFEDD